MDKNQFKAHQNKLEFLTTYNAEKIKNLRSRMSEPPKNTIIIQCQYCGSIKLPSGKWDKINRSLRKYDPYSHGTCPLCKEKVLEKIKEMGEQI